MWFTLLMNTPLLIHDENETSPKFSVEKVSQPQPAVHHESGPLSRITSKSTKPQSPRFHRACSTISWRVHKVRRVFASWSAETSAFSHFLSLSRARVLSFLFLSPAKRRGESRKTGRSDLDKKKRKKKKEKKWRRWLRGRRRSKYVLSAFNDYFILTGEFISGLHYRAWPAPRRRILRTFSPFFFFLSRRGGEISVPRTEGKGRRSITCGLTEHSAPLSAKGRIGRLLFPILFQNTLQKTSEPPPLPRVASIARLPRSFLNKFPSETRSSLPFGYRWNRDASDVACPGENCGIPYQYRNGDTRKYKMEKELNGVTFKRCYWISLQRNKDSLAR